MIREQFLDVNGWRTRWLEAGAGWPVLLIHAFPLNADMWRPQLERVPDGWRFIAPDLRGFGRSRPSGAAGAPIALARRLRCGPGSLLDHLKIDEAVIGGLSMGGYVTFALFRRGARPVHRHASRRHPVAGRHAGGARGATEHEGGARGTRRIGGCRPDAAQAPVRGNAIARAGAGRADAPPDPRRTRAMPSMRRSSR